MNAERFRFPLGSFDCVSLCDGSLDYSPQSFFANVPLGQVTEALRQRHLPTDHITTPYTFLFVNTGQHQVMVDMGAGNLATTTGKLLSNMRAAGIDPAAIDTVIITHAHPDHVGGTLDEEGKPVYLNAHYVMFQREWDFWFSETAPQRAPQLHVDIARRNLEPIANRLELIDEEAEIVLGIRAVAAYGHTPGHMVVSVSSGGHQLLYISDTVLYPLHLEHPDWLPVFDILPEEAAESKQRIFDRAAEERALVLGMHFPPSPSLGYVARQAQGGWQWRPMETPG